MANPPAPPAAGSSSNPSQPTQTPSSTAHPHPQPSSNSKVNRSRSLTKPERYRPRQGMLNRTPSQKARGDLGFQENDSTGNLIQVQHTNPTSSSSSSSAAAAAAQEQHQQRLRLQQANQPQQRPRPRRMSTLRRTGTNRTQGGPGAQPQRRPSTLQKAKKKLAEREVEVTAWVVVSRIFTCCIPSAMLRCCNGKKFSKAQVVQAWREKVTLCIIILLICGLLAFVIFGLQPVMCPTDSRSVMSYSTQPTDGQRPVKDNQLDSVIIRGSVYPFEGMQEYLRNKKVIMSQDYRGRDITPLFYDSSRPCSAYTAINVTSTQCVVPNPYNNTPIISKPCLEYRDLGSFGPKARGKVSFLWTDLNDESRHDFDNVIIYDGKIFNVTEFLGMDQVFGSEVNSVLTRSLRKDSSLLFSRTEERKKAIGCLEAMTEVGVLENTTMGCFAAKTIMLTTLICICMVVGIKFVMALTFSWFLSYRLTEKPRTVLKPSTKDKEAMSNSAQDLARGGKKSVGRRNLFTAMLVTCYSEGENSIRTTLDSLANTSYSSRHKLLVVICDGVVRGHGNKMTTPDIVVNMLELAPGNESPKASSYLAIADGEKQHNMAKVYAGHYVYKKKRLPTVVIVKCGNPLEKDATKPGNRGKRDSQLILMSFFQRVLFADRFTELDFELFHKIHLLMNVWPDRFELCLMVDADTMVKGDSLSYMVTAMQNDHTIMGLCGETKIANKTASWVTAIQVFEYFISHHLGKAFESVFGGVTCLPGCFCMYRIKAPKNDSWVPILANPEVIQEYNQNIVSTLHQKNLLLLGEDRYLTTLMLRTFPKRQMVFVPQAQCKTVVPDTFSVLLSQRRRWINSTIHNLLELVLVTDLCGIAFLSMQFVVLLELIGTIVLPAAILFGLGMIIYAVISQTLALLPLILIIVIIGLPAVLIVLTTRKWIYVLWMLIYLISLPIWNFILPLYAFWHFDDFSWGETRKVANQRRKSGQDHGDAEGVFESGSIIMRKWEEWEKERLKALGYRIQKRHSADRGINDLPPPAASTMDKRKGPKKSTSNANLGSNNSTLRSGPFMGAAAGGSTHSLGSTLNGSSGSLRAGTPTGQRQLTSHPMPQSTPNLGLSQQQQHQHQQQQQLQHRQSLAMGSMGRPPRPRPPHMVSHPPPVSMGPGSRGMGLDGKPQAFEMGPLPSSGSIRVSYMPTTGGPSGLQPTLAPGGAVGLEARHSIHGGVVPVFRPMGSPRPMRPMAGPPGTQSGPLYPMSRPMPPPQQGFVGQPGPGFGPGPRPRPPPSFSGPMHRPPPPTLMLPDHFQQQQQQQPPLQSQQPHHPSQVPIPPPTDQMSQAGASYPLPPPSSAALMPGDRHSQISDVGGQSSSGTLSAGVSRSIPLQIQQASQSADDLNDDGIVLLSDEFHVPSSAAGGGTTDK
ncbi:hypothetical protein BGZ70_007975 [Mortierella alpina]|uniref:chitin synthase n=1 Tax=Mortierella alpina TaxID=64518 RepID=A0A9P6M2A3_MORAP|nr:hypothetical protein BGZ70_007975 [Mortierella alpina]